LTKSDTSQKVTKSCVKIDLEGPNSDLSPLDMTKIQEIDKVQTPQTRFDSGLISYKAQSPTVMLNGVQEYMPLSPIGTPQANNNCQNFGPFSLKEAINSPIVNDEGH